MEHNKIRLLRQILKDASIELSHYQKYQHSDSLEEAKVLAQRVVDTLSEEVEEVDFERYPSDPYLG